MCCFSHSNCFSGSVLPRGKCTEGTSGLEGWWPQSPVCLSVFCVHLPMASKMAVFCGSLQDGFMTGIEDACTTSVYMFWT